MPASMISADVAFSDYIDGSSIAIVAIGPRPARTIVAFHSPGETRTMNYAKWERGGSWRDDDPGRFAQAVPRY